MLDSICLGDGINGVIFTLKQFITSRILKSIKLKFKLIYLKKSRRKMKSVIKINKKIQVINLKLNKNKNYRKNLKADFKKLNLPKLIK